MQATIQWDGELEFSGGIDDGLKIQLQGGSPTAAERSAMSPMQLILVAMIGCTGMDVISILKKMRQQVSKFEVSAEADRVEEHPKVFSKISLVYRFTGTDLSEESIKKAIELSLNRYCPATAMLRKTAEVDYKFELLDP